MKKSLILLYVLLCTTVFLSYSQHPPGKGKLTSFTEGGVLAGNSQDDKNAPFIFHSSLNYGLNKNLSAGIGIGAEFLRETYLPVTANVLNQIRKNNDIFPFLRIRAGYQIALESTAVIENVFYYPMYYTLLSSSYYPYYPTFEKLNAKGGFMVDPSVGVMVFTRAGFGISLAAGYRYQKLKYTGENDYILWAEYNRLILTLGFIF